MGNFKDFKPCADCENSENPGYIKKGNTIFECDCLKKYHSYITFYKYLESLGVPFGYIDYSLNSYIGEKSKKSIEDIKKIIGKVDIFVREGMQLYFSGPDNTQKTSIACYFLKKVAMKGFSVYYISMPQLLYKLKQVKFARNIEDVLEEQTIIKTIENCGFLVIDDCFDKSKVYIGKSEYFKSLLSEFFSFRIRNNKSQIYVSTITKSNIPYNEFGDSVRLLLNRECLEYQFLDKVPSNVMNSQILGLIK